MKKNSDANKVLWMWAWVFIGGLVTANLILQGNIIKCEEKIRGNEQRIIQSEKEAADFYKSLIVFCSKLSIKQQAEIREIRAKKWHR